jgi:hypothetical protein
MRNSIREAAMVLVVLTCTSVAGAADSVAYNEWRFDSDANPASPDVSTNCSQAAVARIVKGDFASGWLNHFDTFGSVTGYWDMGRTGVVTLAHADPGIGERTLLVKVCQWQDGGIYNELASVAIPGATRTGSSVRTVVTVPNGTWVVEESRWTVPASVTSDDVVITSAFSGSLIESVAIEAAPSTEVSVSLAVQRVGNLVRLTWPVAASGYALEWTSDLSSAAAWQPLGVTPAVEGDSFSVTTDAGTALRLFRLRRP